MQTLLLPWPIFVHQHLRALKRCHPCWAGHLGQAAMILIGFAWWQPLVKQCLVHGTCSGGFHQFSSFTRGRGCSTWQVLSDTVTLSKISRKPSRHPLAKLRALVADSPRSRKSCRRSSWKLAGLAPSRWSENDQSMNHLMPFPTKRSSTRSPLNMCNPTDFWFKQLYWPSSFRSVSSDARSSQTPEAAPLPELMKECSIMAICFRCQGTFKDPTTYAFLSFKSRGLVHGLVFNS